MKGIVIQNNVLGGIADSEYMGYNNSLASIVGLDLYSELGLNRVNQKLSKISSSTIDEFVKNTVVASNGKAYCFSADSGKIWEVDTNLSVSLVHTTTAELGEVKCLGANEFGGYIYWATEKRLHRIPVSGLSDWSTNAIENWAKLNADQDQLGSTGNTYSLTSSIIETSVNTMPIIPIHRYIESVAVYVNTKGTGDWSLVIHDSGNNVVASKTITNVNLPTSGIAYFEFSSSFEKQGGETYHIHITSTVADGDIVSGTTDDLSTAQIDLFTVSNSDYHPIEVHEANLVMYIGDNNVVHQVEADTFSNDAVDLPVGNIVTCLKGLDVDLLIGTKIHSNVNKARVFRWNTYSPSFSTVDSVPEVGINAFIPADNYIWVSAGTKGNIYFFNGTSLELYKSLKGDYRNGNKSIINANAVAFYNGLPMFGLSNSSGNPSLQGVYSLGSKNPSYPKISTLEYPISQISGGELVLNNIEIGSLAVMGDRLLVSWKDTNSTAEYGLDAIDFSNKIDKAYFETRILSKGSIARYEVNKFLSYYVNYKLLPDNTSIEIWYRQNHEVDGSGNPKYIQLTVLGDPIRLQVGAELELETAPFQMKVVFRTNGNNAPEMEDLTIFVD